MCGDQSRKSYGGALAVLSLPARATRSSAPAPAGAGRLVFHDCGKGSSTATHVTFTPDENDTTHSSANVGLLVVAIHETGDLTKSAIISPFLHRFSMAQGHSASQDDRQDGSVEVPLTYPVKIEVGNDGIIGRRVSLWSQHATDPIAEGIIGYN
ncbi:hypothetical protein GGR53DRAFT_476286 [Hypoxylon sp. FL1150]|nr:hypothetical protein GGR53DRAFT_476286 [Hypoxylon sp. FL1150]